MYSLIDPVAIAFYGCICAALAAYAPARTRRIVRLAIGAGVGIGAAAALPFIRSAIGM